MKDLDLQLNPIDKLHIYRLARRIVFGKMDHQVLTPERADEILAYVKANVVKVKTPEEAKQFCQQVELKFPELLDMEKYFQLELKEKIDDVLKLMIEQFMAQGAIDEATELMEEAEKILAGQGTLDEVIRKLPSQFEQARLELKQRQKS